MKMKKTLIACSVMFSAAAGLLAPVAQAEVAATVGISNMYYWRGYDLGGGAALVGDVNVSANGFIGGLWTSSGDGGLGTEYDIYAGYSGAAGLFNYGVSVVSYNYSNPITSTEAIAPGDYVEIIPSIGYGPFKVTYYDAVAAKVAPLNNKDYSYATAELNFDSYAFKVGHHMSKDGGGYDGVTFFDATYKYNDKLSFTVGKVIADGEKTGANAKAGAPTDIHFVVSLSLPIK